MIYRSFPICLQFSIWSLYMIFNISGKISSHDFKIGIKPAYIELPTPTDLNVVCGCDNPHCHNYTRHGYRWECTWKGKQTCDEVNIAINKKLAYWLFIKGIIEKKNPDIKYSCEILKTSQMAKNVRKKIRIWRLVKKEIENQIRIDICSINEWYRAIRSCEHDYWPYIKARG